MIVDDIINEVYRIQKHCSMIGLKKPKIFIYIDHTTFAEIRGEKQGVSWYVDLHNSEISGYKYYLVCSATHGWKVCMELSNE